MKRKTYKRKFVVVSNPLSCDGNDQAEEIKAEPPRKNKQSSDNARPDEISSQLVDDEVLPGKVSLTAEAQIESALRAARYRDLLTLIKEYLKLQEFQINEGLLSKAIKSLIKKGL